MKKQTRQINGITYTLIDEKLFIDERGKKVREATFREGDQVGEDLDGDGLFDYVVLTCVIPQGCKDVDIMSVDEDCIKPSKFLIEKPNRASWVK